MGSGDTLANGSEVDPCGGCTRGKWELGDGVEGGRGAQDRACGGASAARRLLVSLANRLLLAQAFQVRLGPKQIRALDRGGVSTY